MTCEVHNKEINSQCVELLVRPLYIVYTQRKEIESEREKERDRESKRVKMRDRE